MRLVAKHLSCIVDMVPGVTDDVTISHLASRIYPTSASIVPIWLRALTQVSDGFLDRQLSSEPA
jgi:hypothetical protein